MGGGVIKNQELILPYNQGLNSASNQKKSESKYFVPELVEAVKLDAVASSAQLKKLQLPDSHLKNSLPWFGPSLRTVRTMAGAPH